MKKFTIPFIFAFTLLFASCGANEETEKTVKEDSVESLKAADFISAYASNKADYDSKYLDQAITVSGEVVLSESADEDGFKIEIKGASEEEMVNCLFEAGTMTEEDLPEVGSQAIIKGKCTGYVEDDLMGLKVITMVQCLIK